MKNFLKRYRNAIICSIILGIMTIVNKEVGVTAIKGTLSNIWSLIKLVPPVFVLMGLMDVWIPREKMIKYMGKGSGIVGGLLAFLFGAFAAGPLYAAFPIGSMLLRKGSSIKNVMIFIGTWAATKVTMLLIEISSLGIKFTAIRTIIEIIGIVLIANIIDKVITEEDRLAVYENAEKV